MYACAICSDKICFVLDKMNFVLGKKFCPWQKHQQNILSMAKKFISATYKSKKITLPDEAVKSSQFLHKKVLFMDLRRAEMNFLAMDKIFCLRQKIFVPDKLDFV